MAAPLAGIRETLAEAMEDLSNDGWAITTEYDEDKRNLVIIGVEPWRFGEHFGKTFVFRVPEAIDEVDAYIKAKQMMEQTDDERNHRRYGNLLRPRLQSVEDDD
jgi:hypothetical protein